MRLRKIIKGMGQAMAALFIWAVIGLTLFAFWPESVPEEGTPERVAYEIKQEEKAQARTERERRWARQASDRLQMAEGKEQIKALLKDPESAVFEQVLISRRAGIPALCGRVNSRNAFGGYVGFEAFVITALHDRPVLERTDGFEQVWDRYCLAPMSATGLE